MPSSFSTGSAEVSAESDERLLGVNLTITMTLAATLTAHAQGTVDPTTEACPVDIGIPGATTDITAGGAIEIKVC